MFRGEVQVAGAPAGILGRAAVPDWLRCRVRNPTADTPWRVPVLVRRSGTHECGVALPCDEPSWGPVRSTNAHVAATRWVLAVGKRDGFVAIVHNATGEIISAGTNQDRRTAPRPTGTAR
jgi:hypothetical protein